MTPFELDIGAQPEVVAGTLAHYRGAGAASLRAAADLADQATRVMVVGMGSSRSAALPTVRVIDRRLPAGAVEAGELLHYGLSDVGPECLVVLVSQSGRSVETVAVAERLAARGHPRVVAVTNDADSPLAAHAQVVLPILAGTEATVATKTWATTFTVLALFADALAPVPGGPLTRHPADALVALTSVAATVGMADAPASGMGGCVALMVVGRGPAHAAADYGALILKETVAMPAEAFSGGSFRHGPLEVAGPSVGVIVLAPSGPTRSLCEGLASETAALGSPTWLVTDDGRPDGLAADRLTAATDRPWVTTLPAVDEAWSPLTMSVPMQRFAAAMARGRGRVPGVLLRSQKVTDRE